MRLPLLNTIPTQPVLSLVFGFPVVVSCNIIPMKDDTSITFEENSLDLIIKISSINKVNFVIPLVVRMFI
jgi:hypothetical protein